MIARAHDGPPIAAQSDHLASPDPLATLMLHLADELLAKVPLPDRLHIGLVIGTTRGCIDADIAFDRSRREHNARYASPAAFARTLPSTLAAEISVKLKIGGPLLSVTAGNASAHVALQRAASWMRHLQLPLCLAGACDADSPDRLRAGLILLHPGESPPHLAPTSIDLAAPRDQSLDSLIALIQSAPRADQ